MVLLVGNGAEQLTLHIYLRGKKFVGVRRETFNFDKVVKGHQHFFNKASLFKARGIYA